jgi:hypothetical protein
MNTSRKGSGRPLPTHKPTTSYSTSYKEIQKAGWYRKNHIRAIPCPLRPVPLPACLSSAWPSGRNE